LEAAKKYKQSSLSPLKSQDYLRHLQKMMTEHHLYRDPEISLAALAEQMGIPPKHLSQIINERLGQNFKNFINRYRVEEAKIKILDPREKDFVLLKIAYDVGFNSKSVFNAAFKKHAGMSPTEYRRKYGREGSPGD
jgi:AraC-like DNA-binding protein